MMVNLGKLELAFDADAVMRGQGADPTILRARRPALAQIAEQALEEGSPLVEPSVICRAFEVEGVRHERLMLEGGVELRGKLIAEHLGMAKRLYVLLCTIGPMLETYAGEMWSESITLSLALDGVGSAAVEALANAACRRLEEMAAAEGWQTSIPISPGMVDWPVGEGQPQIFNLLAGRSLEGQARSAPTADLREVEDEKETTLPVTLTDSAMMTPRKSLTMVVGTGPEMITGGKTCDFCSLREVCRYQDHYASA